MSFHSPNSPNGLRLSIKKLPKSYPKTLKKNLRTCLRSLYSIRILFIVFLYLSLFILTSFITNIFLISITKSINRIISGEHNVIINRVRSSTIRILKQSDYIQGIFHILDTNQSVLSIMSVVRTSDIDSVWVNVNGSNVFVNESVVRYINGNYSVMKVYARGRNYSLISEHYYVDDEVVVFNDTNVWDEVVDGDFVWLTHTKEWTLNGKKKGTVKLYFSLDNVMDFDALGEIYLINEDGLLLASNRIDVVDGDKRIYPKKSGLCHLKCISNQLVQKYGSLMNIKGDLGTSIMEAQKFQSLFEKYYVSVAQFEVSQLSFLVLYILEQKMMFNIYDKGNVIATSVAHMMITLTVLVGLFFVCLCIDPILKLKKTMKMIELMKLNEIKLNIKGIFYGLYENKSLTYRLQLMINKLKKYQSFLPNFLEGVGSDEHTDISLVSLLSDESISSHNSFGSTESQQSSIASINKDRGKFELGVKNIYSTFCKFVIITPNCHLKKNYIKNFRDIVSIFEKRSVIVRFNHSEILCSFNNVGVCLSEMLKLKRKIDEILDSSGLVYKIFIHEDDYIRGIIGSDTLKVPCVIYPEKFFNDVLDYGTDNSILVMFQTCALYENGFDFVPVNIIQCVNHQETNEKTKYSIGIVLECISECVQIERSNLIDGIHLLIYEHKIDEAIELFTEDYMNKSDFVKQKSDLFVSLANKMREESVDTLMEKLEENGSFFSLL